MEADATGLKLRVAKLVRLRIGCEMRDVVVQVFTVGRVSSISVYPVGCGTTGSTSLSMASVADTSDTRDYSKCVRLGGSGSIDLPYEIAVAPLR